MRTEPVCVCIPGKFDENEGEPVCGRQAMSAHLWQAPGGLTEPWEQ